MKIMGTVAVMTLGAVLLGLGAAKCAAAEPAVSPGAAAIQKAAKDNKYLFIFFWREDTQHSRVMRGVLQAAMKKLAERAESVEIQVADAAEAPIVARYDVSRSPMPLVLAIAPNGAVTKALAGQFTEDQLKQAFVSPCTAECMKGLQERKLVLLCVRQQPPPGKPTPLPQNVRDFTADEQYAKTSKVVVLNLGDAAETDFLKSLQVDPQTITPVTVMMAPPAAVIGSYTDDVTKDQLIAKLKAAQSGGCGPGCSCHH
jgi:hypothetical protein